MSKDEDNWQKEIDKMTIHIEICKSYTKDRWNIRIGDVSGSTDMGNISKEEVISEVQDAMSEYNLEKRK